MRGARTGRAFRTAFEAFVTVGRQVTFALQKDGAHLDGFDEWYEGRRQEMKDDPLCRWFKQARNAIEKEGADVLAYEARFPGDLAGLLRGPEGIRRAVLTRESGYWEVDRGNGTEVRVEMGFVADLPWQEAPPDTIYAEVRFDGAYWVHGRDGEAVDRVPIRGINVDDEIQASDPPLEHLGKPIEETHNPVHLAELYLAYLRNLVGEAVQRFAE